MVKKKNLLLPNIIPTDREKEWVAMPEFIQEDKGPFQSIIVHFETKEDIQAFGELIKQNITSQTKSIYYPKIVIETCMDKVYSNTTTDYTPKYPIYIVSKGRWKSRLTSKALERMQVPYYIIIEKQEYKKYVSVISKKKILILPQSFLDDYDTCDNLGNSKSKGPGAARNFAWEHSIKNGYSYHWVMDDNIDMFFRFNKNLKVPVADGTIFRCMEDFIERYTNIAMAGPQYFMFVSRKSKLPPYILNTRIYSCNLIRNDVPYRWRGRYNEDTDLSLRMLKNKWCTILFNAFTQNKMTTQTVEGGNTKEFYAKEGTLSKSEMLKQMHPYLTRVVWKFNRWHHHVYYRHFKRNKLIRKVEYKHLTGIDNYGMVLKHIKKKRRKEQRNENK